MSLGGQRQAEIQPVVLSCWWIKNWIVHNYARLGWVLVLHKGVTRRQMACNLDNLG